MTGPKIEKLKSKDLNEFRDELFVYLAALFNASSKALAKSLADFLIDLEKVLVTVHNAKRLKKKTVRGRKIK